MDFASIQIEILPLDIEQNRFEKEIEEYQDSLLTYSDSEIDQSQTRDDTTEQRKMIRSIFEDNVISLKPDQAKVNSELEEDNKEGHDVKQGIHEIEKEQVSSLLPVVKIAQIKERQKMLESEICEN